MIACMTLGLLNASPASAAPSGTVTAVQQADQTVIVTYTETGAGPGGMQLRLTDLPRVYGSGYTGCPTDQNGNVNCSVHTAAAYTDSTIRYEFDDLSGNLSWGPYTVDVTPYGSAPPTSVTPQAPTATTPSCTNTAETVTPPTQDGVVWSPSGPTTLQPGDPTVTYTDTPASGYVFPDGTQTSWPFSNDFDASGCGTGGSTPPPPPVDDGPHAGFRALPMPALGLVVNFDGSASTGTAPLTYLWDFGDGTTDNNNVADPGNHTYAQPGMYHVTLTVTDGLGRHVTAFADITVASQAKLVLSPSRGVRAGGIERVGIAATSSDGSAAANTTVAVKVTGADKASGTVATNANGHAVFRYRTHHVGRDHIVVTSSDASASATVTIFHPLEKPTLTVATRHGQLYGYVRTHPAVSRHWVTVYYLRKQNGKTTLRVAGRGLTNSDGRVRVTLQLPEGKRFVLKARMSSHAYAEKFSAPVVVHT